MTKFEINKNKHYQEHHILRLDQVGMFIKNIRLNDGLTQAEMAIACGLSRNTIQKVEYSGNMKLVTLFKIIDAFDLTLEQFFTEME
jgi:transcriptional regulator with XRE-family HTH domain